LTQAIECAREAQLKFRPTHAWWFLTSIEEAPHHFVGFADIHNMYPNLFTMLDKISENLLTVAGPMKLSVSWCFVTYNKVH
jgi:hypothetical protein